MPDLLDVHPASPDEVIAAHRNVHDIWSKGLPLAVHVRYRLDSPSHRRATWFVGCVGGRVVVSLGAYPLEFQLRGRQFGGFAIGSVYTLGEFRGHGYAPQLIEYVEQYEREHGAELSALYSDIKPAYYERLGYALCPALAGWCDPRALTDKPASETQLIPISAREHLPRLMRLYGDYHGAAALSIVRDEAYWQAMLLKFADDTFYALQSAEGAWQGYVRVGRKSSTWRITDFALAEQSETLAGDLYAALISTARAGGAERVGGWLPEGAAAREHFEVVPRSVEITMIKALAPQVVIDREVIAATSRFCEIDHV